jgi:hypothetical protein
MNTDDYIRDGKGHTYRVGSLLGRGLYAKTYAVRGEDGKEWVIKVPLNPSDLPKGHEKLAKTSRLILQEQWRELALLENENLLIPKHQFTSQEGVYCLLYPRNDRSLHRELQREYSIQELLALCIQITEILTAKSFPQNAHGNLHPRNIFVNSNNHIQLSDPVTSTMEDYYQSFLEASGQKTSYTPAEIRTGESYNVRASTTDSYSISLFLYTSIMGYDSSTQIGPDGLNKLLRTNLQTRLLSLLERDLSSNKRFRNRLANQFSRLLNRGLSPRYQPSPPFRFADLRELTARLQDLHDLISPSITHVGKIIFNRPPGSTIFETNENIDFSCSVETAPLLEDHQEIECGIMLFNRDKDFERVRGFECNYDVSRHPSGRLRFALMIYNLPPSNYLLRLAFQIKGSLGEPYIIESFFEVIPAPGYVPPQREIPQQPMDISSRLPNIRIREIVEESNEDVEEFLLENKVQSLIVLPPPEKSEQTDDEYSSNSNATAKLSIVDENKPTPKIVIKDPEKLDAPLEYDSDFDTDFPSIEEGNEAKEPPVVYNAPVQNLPQKMEEKAIEDSPFELSVESLTPEIEEDSETQEPTVNNFMELDETESEEVDDSLGNNLAQLIEKIRKDPSLTWMAILLILIFCLFAVLISLL